MSLYPVDNQHLLEEVDKEFDLPVTDKSLNNLMLFNFNFNELKNVIEFLISNQKKQ